MKRIFIILSIVAITATGCKKNDDTQTESQNRLSISVNNIISSQRSTKSQTTTQDTIWVNDQIYIEATTTDFERPIDDRPQTRATPATNAEALTNLSVLVFNTANTDWNINSASPTVLAASLSKEIYTIAPSYPWTEGDDNKRTLIAIAPKVAAASGTTLIGNYQSLEVVVQDDIKKQIDLCVSDVSQNKNIRNTRGSNNHVQSFDMAHTMTAIGFEAAGYDVMLTEIKLHSINKAGTLNLADRTWSNVKTTTDYNVAIKPDEWLDSEHIQSPYINPWRNITPTDGYLMMIPQTHDNNALIEFTFVGRNEQEGGNFTIPLNKIIPSGSATSEWKPGTKITYRLRMKTMPAITTDRITIMDFKAGAITPPANIFTSDDDDLTFYWTASWLGAYRGTSNSVDKPQTSGYFTPFTTGVNNWANLKFFARNENTSTVADRVATVTMSGKKSGRHTFQVVHANGILVTYDDNGGSGGPSVVKGIKNIEYPASETMPTRNEYAFMGWNTAKDGSGNMHQPGDRVVDKLTTPMTLYAMWTYLYPGSYIPRAKLKEMGWPENRLPRTALQIAKTGNRLPAPFHIVDYNAKDSEQPWKRNNNTPPFGNNESGIGGGYYNLSLTFMEPDDAYPVIQRCGKMGSGWFLPSEDELHMVFKGNSLLGATSYRIKADAGSYWSSSGAYALIGYLGLGVNMSTGKSFSSFMTSDFKYRCVRTL